MAEPDQKTNGKKQKVDKRKSAKITDRQSIHFELWVNGASYREISIQRTKLAKEAGESTRGLSHEQVRQDVAAVLAIKSEDLELLATTHKAGLVEILRDQLVTYGPIAKRKINDETPAAIVKAKMQAGQIINSTVNSLAEILGIKAAVRHEHTGKDGKPVAVVSMTLDDWRLNVQRRREEAERTQLMFENA